MVIKVELFSELRLLAGRKSIDLELEEGSTVKQALEALYKEFGNSIKFKIVDTNTNHYRMTFLVNSKLSDDTVVLKEDDILAIIPPVAGG